LADTGAFATAAFATAAFAVVPGPPPDPPRVDRLDGGIVNRFSIGFWILDFGYFHANADSFVRSFVRQESVRVLPRARVPYARTAGRPSRPSRPSESVRMTERVGVYGYDWIRNWNNEVSIDSIDSFVRSFVRSRNEFRIRFEPIE
jgi:hypothetical protein